MGDELADLLENVDVTNIPVEHQQVIEISRDQFRRHRRADARIVWEGAGLCAAKAYGGERRRMLLVILNLYDDGMLYANLFPGRSFPAGKLLWCVSVRAPNACRAKRGAFWMSEIDGAKHGAKFGRIHRFSFWFQDPRNMAVPYVGVGAIRKGYKATRTFKTVLRSVGAGID